MASAPAPFASYAALVLLLLLLSGGGIGWAYRGWVSEGVGCGCLQFGSALELAR